MYTQAELKVLEKAAKIMERKLIRTGEVTRPWQAEQLARARFTGEEREHFDLIMLDSRHAVIKVERLFSGTIDGASVYPREVVKCVLYNNAAAVILAHNHPSGIAEPSESDQRLTRRLVSALELVDVRVLDHLIVGTTTVSFAERGLL